MSLLIENLEIKFSLDVFESLIATNAMERTCVGGTNLTPPLHEVGKMFTAPCERYTLNGDKVLKKTAKAMNRIFFKCYKSS